MFRWLRSAKLSHVVDKFIGKKDRVGSTYRTATTDNKNFVRSIPGGQGKGVYYLQ